MIENSYFAIRKGLSQTKISRKNHFKNSITIKILLVIQCNEDCSFYFPLIYHIRAYRLLSNYDEIDGKKKKFNSKTPYSAVRRERERGKNWEQYICFEAILFEWNRIHIVLNKLNITVGNSHLVVWRRTVNTTF